MRCKPDISQSVMPGQVLEGQTSTFLFPQPKQNVSVFDFPIWFADSLKPELSGRLKRLDAFAGDDRCFGGVAIQRSPVNFGLCRRR